MTGDSAISTLSRVRLTATCQVATGCYRGVGGCLGEDTCQSFNNWHMMPAVSDGRTGLVRP